ncbi:PAS domain S-box protein, partial [Okeania sp. SIO2G5]|uniref:PAS domain S-box protein n=1 Tax=Okeania sp. SIO2G5 TaxID=2607796 RepID=UPI0013BFFBBF
MVTQHNEELYQTPTLALKRDMDNPPSQPHASAKGSIQAVQADINLVQFRSIFEHVSDGLVVIDLDSGMLLTANPAYCQMHGYSYDEILTLNPLDLIPPSFHPKFLSFLETVREGKQFTCEANCRQPDGTPFYIEIKSVPFLYEEKICALSVIRDVTERVQLQQSIEEQNVQLEKALADLKQAQVSMVQSAKMSSLGQLVAGVAHELNNPVSFIQGNLHYVHNYAQDLLT